MASVAYPTSGSTSTSSVQSAQPRTLAREVDSAGPDSPTVQRTRADSASFSPEALRRLAQDEQARQTPSADGTSGG